MVKVEFKNFQDCAVKFDKLAPIGFVVETGGVWVKTGSKARMLCYKENAVTTVKEDEEPVSLALSHKSIEEVFDAYVKSEGIKNTVSMEIDTEKKVVMFRVKHYEIEKDEKTKKETVISLGESKRGVYKMLDGNQAKAVITLPTELSQEIREANKDAIDVVDGAELSKIFSTLGVLKEPIMISACSDMADSNAMVSSKIFGIMPCGRLQRGVRITSEFASPVAKLITSGDVEYLASMQGEYRTLTLVTKDFFINGLVEKTDNTNTNLLQITNVTKLDYSKFGVSCRKAMLLNVADNLQTLKFSPDEISSGDDNINLVRYHSEDTDIAGTLGKGVSVNMTLVHKILGTFDSVVDIDVAPYLKQNETVATCKNFIMCISSANSKCKWYIPVVAN